MDRRRFLLISLGSDRAPGLDQGLIGSPPDVRLDSGRDDGGYKTPDWLVCALPLLVGCSVSANPYAVHPDTITALRSHTGKSVKLSTFTSDKPGKSEIMCRAVGMVQTPGGVPFEQYVQDAFRTELLVAGLASDSAPVMPMGHLERMHFSTSTEASWELRVTLASSSGRRLTIAEDYAFNWHLIGDQACREAATAMALAVQSLVRKAVQHPEFAGLLALGAAETTAALAPTLAPSEKRPDTRLLNDLRQWAPGKWRLSGGTNVLWIERDLRWSWESSFGGKWSGSGRGEIVDRRLILRGWHSTSIQMSLRLVREVEALVGEPQTNRSYPIAFVRE